MPGKKKEKKIRNLFQLDVQLRLEETIIQLTHLNALQRTEGIKVVYRGQEVTLSAPSLNVWDEF